MIVANETHAATNAHGLGYDVAASLHDNQFVDNANMLEINIFYSRKTMMCRKQ